VDGAAVPTPGEGHILSVTMGGTSVAHYLDGAANGTGTLSTTIADGWNPVGIGTRFDLVTKMKGDFAEMLVFSTALSDEARHEIDAYLGEKYGIAVAGPPVAEVLLGAARSDGEIIISWPIDAAGFVLESTGSLTEINWMSVTEDVEQVDGRNEVRIAVEGVMQYFRLRRP
jgi:hypothetical protein